MTAKKGPIVLKKCIECGEMVKRTYNKLCAGCHYDKTVPSKEYIEEMKAIIRAERAKIQPHMTEAAVDARNNYSPKIYKTPGRG